MHVDKKVGKKDEFYLSLSICYFLNFLNNFYQIINQ